MDDGLIYRYLGQNKKIKNANGGAWTWLLRICSLELWPLDYKNDPAILGMKAPLKNPNTWEKEKQTCLISLKTKYWSEMKKSPPKTEKFVFFKNPQGGIEPGPLGFAVERSDH